MPTIIWLPLLAQVVIPIALLLWLGLPRHATYSAWGLTTVLVAGYLLLIGVAGLWLVVPASVPLVLGVLLAAATVYSVRRVRVRTLVVSGGRAVAGLALRGAAAVVVFATLAHAIAGRRAPDLPLVALTFPLRGGTYAVAAGGNVPLINPHLHTLEGDRFRPYVGQSHAVDLVRLGAAGTRASGLLPADPTRYAIFGDTVRAPCAGRVALAEDGHPDMAPPEVDRSHLAGNVVIVACGDIWVLLGHLAQGTVRVRTGDEVRLGEALGLVGNSGNSGEPHLHVHAQRPGSAAMPLGGAPLPVTFDGRYLARNDRVQTVPP